LQWSQRAKYELQKEVAQIARKRCDGKIREFADCACVCGVPVR